MDHKPPTDAERGVLKPVGWVLRARTFFPYQLYRFAWINWRMLAMIRLSHPRRRAGGKAP